MTLDTVLVTGVAGFVGRHLGRVLAESGACVVGLGLEPGPPPGVPLAVWHTADLREPEPVARVVAEAQPDAEVFNLSDLTLQEWRGRLCP